MAQTSRRFGLLLGSPVSGAGFGWFMCCRPGLGLVLAGLCVVAWVWGWFWLVYVLSPGSGAGFGWLCVVVWGWFWLVYVLSPGSGAGFGWFMCCRQGLGLVLAGLCVVARVWGWFLLVYVLLPGSGTVFLLVYVLSSGSGAGFGWFMCCRPGLGLVLAGLCVVARVWGWFWLVYVLSPGSGAGVGLNPQDHQHPWGHRNLDASKR
jgi:transposase InsO family protein